MEYVITRPTRFARRRRRMRRIVFALCAFTAANTVTSFAQKALAQDDAFEKLVEPSALVARPVKMEERGRYRAAGLDLAFEFVRHDRSGEIVFLCDGAIDPCGRNHVLSARRGTGGDVVFLSTRGTRVLRLTPAGAGTLFGGAAMVPSVVPKKGIAFVRD